MSALQHAFWDEACAEALSDGALLAAMARFEGALALASARAGLMPEREAQAIASAAARARFDAAALATAARLAGTLAIPFVRDLTAKVAELSPEAARYVHSGATSQDVVDTATALCVKAGCRRLLALSQRLGDAVAALAQRHAQTPSVARTLLQPAVPVPFGWKAAVWLSMLARAHAGLRAAAVEACVLQFGGAGGTLAAFGNKGDAVAKDLAAELSLLPAAVTWHSARDGFARLGAEAAIMAGSVGKIARDVSLLMQPEVGEAAEPSGAGRGGSSAMPHKRNPVGCLAALEAALRAPGLAATLLAQLAPEHERGLGQWQSQWFVLRELLCSAGSGLAAMAEVVEGLTVDEAAMRANLERSRGLVYSENVALQLSRSLGKQPAHALTEKLCVTAAREQRPLAEVLQADPQAAKALAGVDVGALFDPRACYGSAGPMIERALALWTQALEP
jgi:3-carboxy-cis,cis-muconate cycloisomerase